MSSLSKYFLISIGEEIDTGAVLGENNNFVQGAYGLWEKDVPPDKRLPAVLRILIHVTPAKRQRRVYNFFARTRGLDVRQCAPLTVPAAALEYQDNPYVLIFGVSSSEVTDNCAMGYAQDISLDTVSRIMGCDIARMFQRTEKTIVEDEISCAFRRLKRVEEEAQHTPFSILARIDEETTTNTQMREALLELMYVCGDKLGATPLAMALAADCFVIERNNSALPCCTDVADMLEHAINTNQVPPSTFRETLHRLNTEVTTQNTFVRPGS